jgi:uncharacterized protein YggU (UPF0235/DUF167 family)
VERVNQTSLGLNKIENETVIYKVSIREAPVAGQANTAIIRALATYFNIAPARVKLITGQTNKQKVFEIG